MTHCYKYCFHLPLHHGRTRAREAAEEAVGEQPSCAMNTKNCQRMQLQGRASHLGQERGSCILADWLLGVAGSAARKARARAWHEQQVCRQVLPRGYPWRMGCLLPCCRSYASPHQEGTAYCRTPGDFVTARSCMQRPRTPVTDLPYYLYRLHLAHSIALRPHMSRVLWINSLDG